MTPYREPDAERVAEQQTIEEQLRELRADVAAVREANANMGQDLQDLMEWRAPSREPTLPWLPWWWSRAALIAQAPLVVGLVIDASASFGHRGLLIGIGVLSAGIAVVVLGEAALT